MEPESGFCTPCAFFADGYASGCDYADDFEGLTVADAVSFARECPMEPDQFDLTEASGPEYESLTRGYVAGLTRHAERNAERKARDDAREVA